ncbi:hypothetical protein [Ancylobacter radicis]|uniref:Uncharacterized protein n=1 Tax=Ancylobacter radicis TaxID=2836179 RepID=A0ABS5R1D9_9HYPH|nr:hypothetical protein [Ancylobacter radicis]MBS9475503.1 hypothetical protein [Ancylobacter radicis]
MISKLRITPIYWLCAFGGLIAFLWIAPAINQLRFSYYPNGLQGGLIKVDRLTGRMELCGLVGQAPDRRFMCGIAR